jgi:parallel beta-helix repeat protein
MRNNTITGITEEGIWLYSSSNSSIVDNNVADNDGGIYLDSSPNDTISKNNIANCPYGISLRNSTHCSISENSVASSTQYGIWLSSSSTHTYLFRNNVTGSQYGIELDDSPLCTIYENQIANNQYGISFVYSLQNKIYHNNFVQNSQAVVGIQGANTWDDGYPSGGNYWSGYSEPDVKKGPGQNLTGSDGIGDTAHTFDAENIDHYPLMSPSRSQSSN